MRLLNKSFISLTVLSSIFAFQLSCQSYSSRSDNAALTTFASTPRDPKLIWITLDALHKEILTPYLKYIKNPHPKGLVWLLNSHKGKQGLNVGFPSITAPSHISTMTCSRPGSHGVFLNGGNWNGVKDLNGFSMPYSTQTWVQALRSSGVSVGAAAYPSIDGSSPERSADLSIAYDSPVGKVLYINLLPDATNPAELSATFEVPSHLVQDTKYSITIKKDKNDKVTATGTFGHNNEIELPYGKVADLFGKDGDTRSAQISFLNMGPQKDKWLVAVSPVSVTPVVGAELQTRLDQKNIIWSNIKDYSFPNFENGNDFYLESIKHKRKSQLAAIKEMLALRSTDVFFMYFEDIDTLLHAWIGVDQMNAKIGEFLAEFDQDLGNLLSQIPASTNIVTLGDHGMTAVQYELNVRSMLSKELLGKFQVRSSGGALFLYPAGSLDTDPDSSLDLEAVAQTLRSQMVEFDKGRKVFNKVITRYSDEAKTLGLNSKLSPWIMAFADKDIGLQNKLDQTVLVSRRSVFNIPESLRTKYPDPMNSGRLVEPTPLGAHGHDSSLDAMKTFLFLNGPEFEKVDFKAIGSTIDVVPFVANRLGLEKPLNCR